MKSSQIGSRIAAKRKERAMTQRQLAEALNVTDKAISRWERGESEPDLNSLIQMAKLLETTTDALLTGEEPVSHSTTEIPTANNSRFPLSVAITIAGYLISLICSCILEPGTRTGDLAGIEFGLLGYSISVICSMVAVYRILFPRIRQENEEEISKIMHFCIFLATHLAANSAAIFDIELINILMFGCLLGEIGFVLSTGVVWYILTPILIRKNRITEKPGLKELRKSVTAGYAILLAVLLWITLAAGFYDEIFLVIGAYSTIPITILFTVFYRKKKQTQ